MTVIRVEKTHDYTVMSNYHLRDRNLSLKAKGLLSQMLSLPEDWDYTVSGLSAINKESTSAIKSALEELKECGYLTVSKMLPNQTDSGRIEYVYCIFEKPQEKQGVGFLPLEFLPLENPTQINTDKQSTDNKRKKNNIVRHRYGEYKNVLLSDEDLAKLKEEFPDSWESWIEKLSTYMASRGKTYSNHLATIRNWARRAASDGVKSQKQEDKEQPEWTWLDFVG